MLYLEDLPEPVLPERLGGTLENSRDMRVVIALMVLERPTLRALETATGVTKKTVLRILDILGKEVPNGYQMKIQSTGASPQASKGYKIVDYGVFDEASLRAAADGMLASMKMENPKISVNIRNKR